MFQKVLRFLSLALVLLAAPPVRADTFELANGGKLKGELLNPDESPRKAYSIKLAEGALITLSPGQVLRVAAKTEAELWYEDARKTMATDIAAHLEIATQCKAKRLEAQRLFHLEEVLKLDSENSIARRELGYTKMDGDWIKEDVFFREQGLVKHEDKWVYPQEVAIAISEKEQGEKLIKWNKQISTWRGWVVKQRDRADEGMQSIQAIDDAAAVPILAKLLDEKKEPVLLKRAYIKVLGRFPGVTSTAALVRRALYDPDARVREDALDQLAERKDKIAVRFLIGILKKATDSNTDGNHNLLVNSAAIGLAKLRDDSATLPLIEALVTKHKFLIKGGGAGLNPVFNKGPGQDGGGGLGIGGGRPEIELREIANQNVRDALISLHPGINFGYDEAAWKRWYEQQRAPLIVDLRREQD